MDSIDRIIGFTRRSDSARMVADLLRFDIVKGRLGETLPPEWQIVEDYRSSRNVVREALSLLQVQNLVRRVPRSGTFALAPGTTFEFGRKEDNVSVVAGGVLAAGSTPVYREKKVMGYPNSVYTCVNAAVLDAPRTVVEELRLSKGEQVLFAEVLITVRGEPQRLRSSWIPLAQLGDPRMVELDCYVPDLMSQLTGEDIVSTRISFEAVNADPGSSEIFRLPEGSALLLSERSNSTRSGTPVEFGFTRHRGDRTVILSHH